MTTNYLFGLATLVVSFVVLFYVPIGYFWIKFYREKHNQNK